MSEPLHQYFLQPPVVVSIAVGIDVGTKMPVNWQCLKLMGLDQRLQQLTPRLSVLKLIRAAPVDFNPFNEPLRVVCEWEGESLQADGQGVP